MQPSITLIGAAVTMIATLCRGAALPGADSTIPPEFGRSVNETLRVMLAEPDFAARGSLVSGYFAELPGADFPEALAALGRFEGRQVSSYLEHLLRWWAVRDPHAALEATKRLIDIAIGGQGHFTDEWSEKIVGPKDRHSFEASPIWPEPRQLLSFLAGLKSAELPEAEKASLRAEFASAYLERFADDPEYGEEALKNRPSSAGGTGESQPSTGYFARVKEVLAAEPSELPGLLRAAAQRRDAAAFLWGARRWIREDGAAGPGALAIASGDEEWGHWWKGRIVKAWARRDAGGALAWFRTNRPEDLKGYAGEGLIAFVDERTRKKLLSGVTPDEDGGAGDLGQLIAAWSEEDPKRALETALALHGPFFYSACADACFTRLDLPSHQRRVMKVIRGISVPVLDGDFFAYMMMESWGEVDVGEAAAYGLEWMQRSRSYRHRQHPEWTARIVDKKHLVRVWTGLEDPDDGSMDDRTYGCLRKWAVCQPEQMRIFVEREKDPKLRRALVWLLEHPNGEGRTPPPARK
jgi:hypothetical protein